MPTEIISADTFNSPVLPEVEEFASMSVDMVEEAAVTSQITNAPLMVSAGMLEEATSLSDPYTVKREWALTASDYAKNAFTGMQTEALELGDVDVSLQALGFLDAQQEKIDRAVADPLTGTYNAIQIYNRLDVDQALSDGEYFAANLAKKWDGAPWYSLIDDFAFLLATGNADIFKDISDFTGVANPVDAVSILKDMIVDFQSRTFEEKKVLWEGYKKKAEESSDANLVKEMMLLGFFLDPNSGAVTSQLSLGAIDAGLILTGLYSVAKAATSVGRLNRLANANAAATVQANTLTGTAGAAATNRFHAASSTHPFNWSVVTGQPHNAGPIATHLQGVANRVDAVQQEFRGLDEIITLPALSEAEKVAFETQKITDFSSYVQSLYQTRGWSVQNATLESVSDINGVQGFKVKVDLYDPSGTLQTRMSSHFIDYTTDGITVKDAVGIPKIKSALASPEMFVNDFFNIPAVLEASFGQQQASRAAQIFQKSLKQAAKGLKAKERQRVDAVLYAGNVHVNSRGFNLGKVYNWDELTQTGVHVPGHQQPVILSAKEAESYYASRHLMDMSFTVLENMVRRNLIQQGWKQSKITFNGRRMHTYLKPFDDVRSIPTELSTVTAGRAPKYWDTRSGSGLAFDQADIANAYAAGYRMTRIHPRAFKMNQGTRRYNYALIHQRDLGRIEGRVLQKRRGYVPQIFEDTPWVVVERSPVMLNGTTRDVEQTAVRLFNNETDATQYAADLQLTAAQGKTYAAQNKHRLDKSLREQLVIDEAGGLFIDPRKHKPLMFGLNGTLPKTVNPFEAMNRQLSFIANNLPLNEWRLSITDRWMKMARPYMKEPGNFHSELINLNDERLRNALEVSRRWVYDQVGIRTADEYYWEASVSRLADWVNGSSWLQTKLARGMNEAAGKDPFALGRKIAFYPLLGYFNPSQLVVQGAGMAVVMGVAKPTEWLNILKYQTYLLAGRVLPRNSVAGQRHLAQAAGISHGAAEDFRTAWEMSGFGTAVRHNADIQSMLRGSGVDNGIVGKFLDGGMAPYYGGEYISRSAAFALAYMRKVNQLGGRTALTSAELVDVSESAYHFTLNLSRANRAAWQKGALSIPTQFKQYTTKFVEALVGKKWTAGEKMRVLGMQALFWGAAGIPAGKAMTEWVISTMGWKLSEEEATAVSNGLFAGILEMFFDEAPSVSKRTAGLSGIEDLYKSLFVDPVPWWEVLGGPLGGVMARTSEAVRWMMPMMPIINEERVEITGDEAIRGILEITDIISTFRNIHQAFIWDKYDGIVNKYGELINKETLDSFETVRNMKMLGFSSLTEEDTFNLYTDENTRHDAKTDLKKAIKQLYAAYMTEDARMPTDKEIANMYVRMRMLLEPYENKVFVEEVRREVHQEILFPKEGDKLSQALRRRFEAMLKYGEVDFTGSTPDALNTAIPRD